MKLSQLIGFRNRLELLQLDLIKQTALMDLRKISHIIDTQPDHYTHTLGDLETRIGNEFDLYQKQINELIAVVNNQISEQEKYWFQETYRLYDEEMRNEHHDYILNRRPQVTPEEKLRARLRAYSDWRYPGMIIRPGLETFPNEMVSNDPLYLIDTNRHLLGKVPHINGWTPEYQARVRSIIVEENLDHDILEKVPNEQFGLCLVYNFFNFRPLEYIRKYLTEIYQKLRPGGVLIMTINDCDREPGVRLAETYFACYTPGGLIIKLAETIGYKQSHTWHENGPITFIEIRKPGELESLRGGQTLAKIIYK